MSIPRTIRVNRNNPFEPGRECRAFSPGHVMSRAFVLAATDRIIVGCNDTLEEEGMSGLGTKRTLKPSTKMSGLEGKADLT